MFFEKQERHHYTTADYTYEPLTVYQERDKHKIDAAKAKGISLIIVPCWWDETAERSSLLTQGIPIRSHSPSPFLLV